MRSGVQKFVSQEVIRSVLKNEKKIKIAKVQEKNVLRKSFKIAP
jgi:hypothetical protein